MAQTPTTPVPVPWQYWEAPFNHQTINVAQSGGTLPNPNATDHLLPLGGWSNPNISYFTYGLTYDWNGGRMNAVHMALVPKGQHRGKVLVWGATVPVAIGAPILVRAPGSGPTLQPNEYHSCAPWSIVDPAPTPVGPRFRNYLLPLEKFTPSGPTYPGRAASLFCAGQAWSPFGDLIVAGGASYGPPTLAGPRLTFAFNPSLSTAGWPYLGAGGGALYPGQLGLWQPGPPLALGPVVGGVQQPGGRFYPTTTMTHRLNRLSPPKEVMLVLGGSVDDASTSYLTNHTWNTYEGLVINGPVTAGASGLTTDVHPLSGLPLFDGPGTVATPAPVDQDWLEDYPRCHLLSTGRVLFSGYAPRWATVNHDSQPGVWTRQAGAPPYSSTAWHHRKRPTAATAAHGLCA